MCLTLVSTQIYTQQKDTNMIAGISSLLLRVQILF